MFFRAFTRLLRRDPPPPAAADALRDLGRVETFPVLSDTAVRAMELANDPDATLADLAGLIRRDGVLTAAVLKLANSAAYAGQYPADSVRAATARLGLKGCYQVLAAVGARAAFGRGGGAAPDALLRHGLFTAALAAKLAAAGGLGFRGEEFAAGLLHDIGRVILCARAPDAFAAVDPLSFREGPDDLARERAALGTDHCEVGGRFAEANRLPKALAVAIRHHHAPEAAPDHRVLTAVVAAADALANHAQRERRVAGFRPAREPGFALLPELVGADTAAAVARAAPAAAVAALRETRSLLRLTDR